MPRRMITSEIWFNEKVAILTHLGRLLFVGIISNADDDGRLKASAKFLKAHILPYDDDVSIEAVQEQRDKCDEVGLIRLYKNGDGEFLDIVGWLEHQSIRKDRYTPSKLPSFEKCQPLDNQPTTTGLHNKGEGRGGKDSLNTPLDYKSKGARTKKSDPVINQIYSEMRRFLGYPEERVCGGEAVPALEESSAMTADRRAIDPIPNYPKEGTAIKRMLTRGFKSEEILACWKSKVTERGGDFVSMTWVNEDIGKKGVAGGQQTKRTAPRRVDGSNPPSAFSHEKW